MAGAAGGGDARVTTDPFTAADVPAIQLHELLRALMTAGFRRREAMTIVVKVLEMQVRA